MIRGTAEDVYYVTRDGREVFGLNQLMTVPPLTAIELRAVIEMCDRGYVGMACLRTYTARGPEAVSGLGGLEHGLYYVDQDGYAWALHRPQERPDLEGSHLDFARATVEAGRDNLNALVAGLRA